MIGKMGTILDRLTAARGIIVPVVQEARRSLAGVQQD